MWNTQCTLIVAVLLVATGVLVQASTEHCVVPSEESVCTCNVTCHTLDVYLSSPGDYFKSGVTFRFLPGVHQVHNTFSGSNIHGLSFVKDDIHSNVTLILYSHGPSSWFYLQSSSDISFSGLEIHMNIYVPGFMFELTDVDNVIFSELHLFHNGILSTQGGGGMNINGGHNISIYHITYESYGAYLLYVDNTNNLVLEYSSVKGSLVATGISIGQSINVNFCYFEDCYINYLSEGSLMINNSLLQNTTVFVICSNSTISLENSMFEEGIRNPNVPAIALLIEGRETSYVILNNVTIQNNSYNNIPASGFEIIAAAVFYEVQYLHLINCSFVGNAATALYVVKSDIFVHGKLNFTGNSAYEGAAMYFGDGSFISVDNDAEISFTHNHADYTGGGIKVDKYYESTFEIDDGVTNCFLHQVGSNVRFTFSGNRAQNGGDAIYGGQMDQTITESGTSCVDTLMSISHFINSSPNNLSLISSDPSRVCICEDNRPQCLEYTRNVSVYPGQTFSISAYVVGQHFGTAKGTVHAQFLNKSTTAYLKPQEYSQNVGQYFCDSTHNVLNYTILTNHSERNETLVLTPRNVPISEFPDQEFVRGSILQVQLYLNITLLGCPPCFQFSSKDSGCVCVTQLQQLPPLYSITCDIQTQRVQRSNSLWINASNSSFLYSEQCPLSHCNATKIRVDIKSPDIQCIYNHSGTLCGGCLKGCSLAIGSSRCLPHCSNNFLSLLLVFAAAGVLLVVAVKYLNLTVTQGTINGLIFYANIVQTNQSAFLASNQTGVRVFAVFIAWLNLDFGIETCFINGLDMYTKTWLQFVFPLYLWALAGGIILVCHFSVRATRFLGNNAVQVLATLFLLSYNKLLQTITVVFSPADVVHVNTSKSQESSETVWAFDGNLQFLGYPHALLFAFSTTVFVLLWIPFTLFILFGQWIQRYNHVRGLRWVGRMRPLVEAYYGPLKVNHHYWVGVLLLARVVVSIIPAIDPFASTSVKMLSVVITMMLLLLFLSSVGRVYKKYYNSLLENSFLANLAGFAALTAYLEYIGAEQALAVYIMIGLSFAAFVLIITIQLYLLLLKLLRKENDQTLVNGYTNLDSQMFLEDQRD